MKKILILIIWLIPLLGFAQTIEQNLVKPQKLFVGTPFHLLVDITASATDSIYSSPIDTLDVFILRDLHSQDVIENEQIKTELDFTFQPFDTGEFTFPELEFAVVSASDTTFLKTTEFVLKIESVLTDSSEVVKDIAAPLKINLGFWDYFLPILILAVLIVVVIFMRKALKSKNLEVEKNVITDSRQPYEIVLELLNNIIKENLPAKGEFLRFHFRLSYLLRLFLELHYRISAVEMTTSEIRSELQLDDFKEKSQIIDFLSFADKIKFAKFQPTVEESNEQAQWLHDYLESFKKRIETSDNGTSEQEGINA